MGENCKKINDKKIHQLLIQGRSYFDILLHNCYKINPDYDKENNNKVYCGIIDRDKLSQAFDDFIDNYNDLLSMGISLSGYQFVGIILEKNLSLTENMDMRIAYFMLSFGFLISMFGVLICFITVEYLRGCREEEPEFIVAGIQKYKHLFKMGDIILYCDCILFTVPINLLIYNSLDYYYGVIYNIFCVLFLFLGFIFHYTVIVAKQQYNITDDDLQKKLNTDICGDCYRYIYGKTKYAYNRRLYSNGEDKNT